MKNNLITVKIVGWLETIISARILLFCIPVLLSKYLQKNFSPLNLEDWFIVILTYTAFVYFLVGVSTLTVYRSWRFLHYAAFILTAVVTSSLVRVSLQTQIPVHWGHFIPLSAAIFVILVLKLLEDKQKQ